MFRLHLALNFVPGLKEQPMIDSTMFRQHVHITLFMVNLWPSTKRTDFLIVSLTQWDLQQGFKAQENKMCAAGSGEVVGSN